MSEPSFHSDWLVPDWPAPPRVRAVFTSRQGGHSEPPYDSLNLGDHVGDDATRVQINRDELQRRIAASPVFLQQVHGSDVVHLSAQTRNGTVADAAVTSSPKTACTIMVADCLPVLLCDETGTCVGALHAGWRGLASGVIEATVTAMRESTQGELHAWLGPCIGPEAFEVGDDVLEAFTGATSLKTPAQVQSVAACFAPLASGATKPKFLANLPGLARLVLSDLGVSSVHGNDGSAPWCTVSNPSRFFSHRRDAATRGGDIRSTGRMAACIWLN